MLPSRRGPHHRLPRHRSSLAHPFFAPERLRFSSPTTTVLRPPLRRRFRPPPSLLTTQRYTRRFAIAVATRPYHPPPANRRRSPLSGEPEGFTGVEAHVAATSPAPSASEPPCRLRVGPVTSASAHACHRTAQPEPEPSVDSVHEHRATDSGAHMSEFQFIYFKIEKPRADVSLRNNPVFL